MEDLKRLIQIIDRLLGPNGCPWDREQTLQSMRSYLVEETYELIEAIDLDQNSQIEEELGDLLFLTIFLCKLAEKEQRFSLKDVTNQLTNKLIRRHPHVFGEAEAKTTEEALNQWMEIKKKEKKERSLQSTLDHIPKNLPILSRSYKVAKKLASNGYIIKKQSQLSPEEEAGESLWSSIQTFSKQGIHAEHALRKRLMQIEAEFKEWETQQP